MSISSNNIIIGVIGQKGGISKTVNVITLAREYTLAGWSVLVADMDVSQKSSVEWTKRRKESNVNPPIHAKSFNSVVSALETGKDFDMIIFDGAPHATNATKEIASISDLIILPTGASIMDLNPQIKLAHELLEQGVDKQKITFLMNRLGSSILEIKEAREYLEATGYNIAKGGIPEKTAFRRAFLEGKTLMEVTYPSLKKSVETVMKDLVKIINELNT